MERYKSLFDEYQKASESKLDERKKVSTRFEIEEIIKKVLLHYYEDMYEGDLYPYDVDDALKEVEHESRPGFIPYTDGGFTVTGFTDISDITGSGYYPKPKEAVKIIDQFANNAYEWAKEKFMKDNPDLVEELGEDKINYHDLYKADYGEKAEELSEIEMEYMSGDDSSIMFELGVFYYEKGNTQGNFADEADSVYVYGVINWEAPYHRSGKGNEWIAKNNGAIKIDPNSKTFKKELTDKIRKIVGEF